MHAMFEYTLPAGLLITGNVRAELAGFRQNNSNNISRSIAAHIRNGGTHKATVVQAFTATNFYGFTPGHVQALLATPIVDDGYITVAGDILYLEVGLGWAAVASDCNVTVGYNNANADWPDGADGTVDTSPTVKNPWFEFTTTLGPAPTADDFLLTLSATTVAARPSSPSKPGLHFYDRTTHIQSIWDGTTWTNMMSSITVGGVTASGVLGFSSTFGVSVTLTGNTVTWDAQALSVEANRNRTLRLTDDGTEGALLTASATFGVNAAAILAPNATNALRIGKYANIALAGSGLVDTTLLNFTKVDFSETAFTPTAMAATITNRHHGTATVAARGIVGTVTASMADGTTVTTNSVVGCNFSVTGGQLSGFSTFQGTCRGYQTTVTFSASTIGTPAVLAEGFRVSGSVNRSLLTDWVGYRMTTPTVAFSGVITNVYGALIDSIGTGTNRWGMKTSNKIENAATDFIASAAGKGVVVKDLTDGNFYRVFTANGFIQTANLGATAPTA
jgi:hypothetical protein